MVTDGCKIVVDPDKMYNDKINIINSYKIVKFNAAHFPYNHIKKRSYSITGPQDSRRLRLPDFKTISTCRWQGCQPYAPATFTPRKYSWY
jgi:hypothetical protein